MLPIGFNYEAVTYSFEFLDHLNPAMLPALAVPLLFLGFGVRRQVRRCLLTVVAWRYGGNRARSAWSLAAQSP